MFVGSYAPIVQYAEQFIYLSELKQIQLLIIKIQLCGIYFIRNFDGLDPFLFKFWRLLVSLQVYFLLIVYTSSLLISLRSSTIQNKRVISRLKIQRIAHPISRQSYSIYPLSDQPNRNSLHCYNDVQYLHFNYYPIIFFPHLSSQKQLVEQVRLVASRSELGSTAKTKQKLFEVLLIQPIVANQNYYVSSSSNNYFMQNPEVQNQTLEKPHPQNQCRAFFISSLQNVRSQHPEISRDVVFLALAVIDKFLREIHLKNGTKELCSYAKKSFMLASLWIALKFLDKSSLVFRQILKVDDSVPSISQIIDAESQILDQIEFELPTDHTYAVMVQSFLSTTQQDSREIATQCLKFYGEAIKISNEFVLCGQLGPKILEVIKTKTMKDKRLKYAYIQIKKTTAKAKFSSLLGEKVR